MATDGDIRGVVATGIKFSDGSIVDFTKISPPEAGSVLVFGMNDDDTEFVKLNDDDVELSENIGNRPMAPANVATSTALSTMFESEAAKTKIIITWEAPTQNEDGSELVNLTGFELQLSEDGIAWERARIVGAEITSFEYDELPQNALYELRIRAISTTGYSDWVQVNQTTASDTPPPDVANIVLSSFGTNMISATWDPITKTSLWGYVIQIAKSTNLWVQGGSPSAWDAWSADIVYPTRSAQNIRWQHFVSAPEYWYKIRVKAVAAGGLYSDNWTESSALHVVSINANDFNIDLNQEIADLVGSNAVQINNSGIVAKNSKFLLYSDDGTGVSSVVRVGTQFWSNPVMDEKAFSFNGSSAATSSPHFMMKFVAPSTAAMEFQCPLNRSTTTGSLYIDLYDSGKNLLVTLTASCFEADGTGTKWYRTTKTTFAITQGSTYYLVCRTATGTHTHYYKSSSTPITCTSYVTGTPAAEVVGGANWVVASSGHQIHSAFRFYTPAGFYPQVAAYNSAGQRACIGQTGTFWGLYVEGGAISVKTGSDQVTIDSSGIAGVYGAVTKFALNSSGLLIDGADIRLTNGGQLLCVSVDTNNSLRVDATYGIRAIKDSVTRMRITHEAIKIYDSTGATRGVFGYDDGTATDGVRILNGYITSGVESGQHVEISSGEIAFQYNTVEHFRIKSTGTTADTGDIYIERTDTRRGIRINNVDEITIGNHSVGGGKLSIKDGVLSAVKYECKTDYSSAGSADGVWIQDSYTTTKRWKLFYNSNTSKLTVSDGTTTKTITLA